MTTQDDNIGRALAADEAITFEALIAAALRKASTSQHNKLAAAFPHLHEQVKEMSHNENDK